MEDALVADIWLIAILTIGSICNLQTHERGAIKIAKATNNGALSVYEILEQYNSFILVLKVNGKVRLYLDLARLNKVNDILQRLADGQYPTLIDASSGSHYL